MLLILPSIGTCSAGAELDDENGIYSGSAYVYSGTLTSTGEGAGTLPPEFVLDQNYPNPFNPTTTIEYALSRTGYVKLEVFNVLGQRVMTLHDGVQATGYHSVVFDAERLPSGIYLYRLQARDFIGTKKLLLLK